MKRSTRFSRKVRLSALLLLSLGCAIIQPWSELTGVSLHQQVSANSAPTASVLEGTIFAVTAGNNLINFNPATPGALNRSVAITGLQSGENILGLDFRPRTGQLYGLGSTSRVYVINPSSGAATAVGAGAFTPALSGNSFAFDFNPVPDRIRVASEADQNLRLHPDTGAVAGADTNLAYATGDPNAAANPNVVGAAYTSSFDGASSTTLFGIDSALDILVRQGSPGGAPTSPNTGQLSTIGALGVDTTDQVGFDIAAGDVAYASLTLNAATTSSLYSLNLTTGAATLIGAIGGTEIIRDIAAVVRVENVFGVTASNRLISFNSGTPGTLTSSRLITGLGAGETITGIDFRPATGQLFAVSSSSRVYTINTDTAIATPAGGAALSPAVASQTPGVDFNPAVDRIRVSGGTQNLRINPNNGAIAGSDTALAYATGDPGAGTTPNVTGAAYTNNVAGTTTTTLYVIDADRDALALQGSPGGTPNSPNGGQLTTVGALGVNTSNQVGFDIAPSGAAFVALSTAATTSGLFTINLTSGAATSVGAIGGGELILDIAIQIRAETIYAVTASNRLISFNSLTPGVLTSTVPLSGLQSGENIIGIDFRPATGQLFAAGSSSRVYLLNPVTGGATPVAGAFTPALSGTAFGFDFNPVPDRIRVVSTAQQNLRLNPDTGTVAGTDTNLVYATGDPNAGQTPNIVGAAYNNNFAGTTSTTLFVIDSSRDALVRQGSPGGAPTSPNTGQLFTVGALGVNTNDSVGFDIADCTGNAYASLTTGAGASQLYTINLVTGAATAIGAIGGGEVITGISVGNIAPFFVQLPGVTVTNAASFATDALAPDSIVAIFGAFQTQNGQAFSATNTSTTTLGGITVTVNGTAIPLFFTSNGQINALLPAGLNDGPATVVVTNSDGSTRVGTINVARSGPGIFTFSGSGSGTAIALTFDGTSFGSVINSDGSPREISAGTSANPVFLVLYTTGLRNTPAANPNDGNGVAEAVTATIQGVPATVTFAGPAPGFVGADQVNLIIPPELAGYGTVRIRLTAGGRSSNTPTVRIGGQPPVVRTVPIISGQTIAGRLTTDDQVQDAGDGTGLTYFFDAFRFQTTAATSLAVSLTSTQFDATVLLFQEDTTGGLTLLAADDLTGGLGNGDYDNTNALLLTVLPGAGNYVIFATSADTNPNGTGSYQLRLATNLIQPITYGANINGTISFSDLQTSAGDFLDVYSFNAQAGDNVQIRMTSAAFDSFLILNRNSGELVEFNDNGGGGLDAQIFRTLTQTGTYLILATPFEPGRTGAYNLTLTNTNAPTANEPAEAAEAESRVTPLVGRVLRSEAQVHTLLDQYSARRIVVREKSER
jgi:uncharacterized protein (TIGR03437 family)